MYTRKKDIIIISREALTHFSSLQAIKSKHFKIQYSKTIHGCLGIIIPKKHITLAVSRNLLRRKMRGMFRNMKGNRAQFEILVSLRIKILAEKKAINDILLPEWKSLLDQLS